MKISTNIPLKITCIGLLIYSLIAGMIVPLKSNIVKADYERSGDYLEYVVEISNSSNSVDKFYLIQENVPEENAIIILADEVKHKDDFYPVRFLNPNNVAGVEKGMSFSLVTSIKDIGDLRYFNAYFVDTVIGNVEFERVERQKFEEVPSLTFPNRPILKESIRNLFYHVPLWFAMMALLLYSTIKSVRFLSSQDLEEDIKSFESVRVAMYFGVMGLITGMIWAKYTWGAFWTNDPKLNGTAVGMLIYVAYIILRKSIDDELMRAKLSSVYNIFAFVMFMVFIMILPRIYDSLHPGNGGNPAFNVYEQDNVMRLVFYPAVIGFILLAFWIKEKYVAYSLKNMS